MGGKNKKDARKLFFFIMKIHFHIEFNIIYPLFKIKMLLFFLHV